MLKLNKDLFYLSVREKWHEIFNQGGKDRIDFGSQYRNAACAHIDGDIKSFKFSIKRSEGALE